MIAIEGAVGQQLPRAWHASLLRSLLLAQYTLFGMTFGLHSLIWGDVQRGLGLGEGLFGSVMVVTPLVGFALLLTASQHWRRFGQRRVAVAGLLAVGGALFMLGVAQSLAGFLAARLLAGLGFALLESAANNAALDWEAATGRRVISVLYGFFSVGMVLGALGGGLLLQAGLSYRAALLLLAPLLLLAAAATAACRYPPERQAPARSGGAVPPTPLRHRGFLVLAAISLLGVAAESIVDLWAIIYLRERGAGALAGSIAFALFSGAMVGGRFANATVLARWGTSTALRSAAAGVVLAALLLAVGGTLPSVAAFALLALAVAGVLPTVMSATREHFAGESEAAVNGIVSTTYLGFVIAPPAVGWLAELCGLQAAMLFFLAGVAAALLALVGRVGRA